ncbi:helix-turn-helix domain-containing protein, partial [Micrococcus sp. GbtcB5]|uniref:AlbA family DNA-binding domain-containing protein n=1 Tax=Micrococcus sp. GbtcB5 TaxID=2824750 RepID=UPI001C304890
TLDVEFKRRLGKVDLYQAVVCMANGTGGLILVGVDDDGTGVGATGDHGGPVDADRLAGRIQNGIEPPFGVGVGVGPRGG